MSDKPNRRWFQFSLRMLLAVVTLAAVGSGWWKHRSVCLEQIRVHAERHTACARKMFGELIDGQGHLVWTDFGLGAGIEAHGSHGEDYYSYDLTTSPTSSGFEQWLLTVKRGKLSDTEQRIQTELDREAELAQQYSRAIWRPWERFWIED